MHRLATAIRRLLGWLAEQEPRPDQAASPCDWADRPVHHPRNG
jgi:hypothetical protein